MSAATESEAFQLAEKAMLELVRQLNEMDGHRQVLAGALAAIREIASDNVDIDSHDWNTVHHICDIGGVRAAMNAGG